MKILKYGIRFDESPMEIILICTSPKYGAWYLISGDKEEVEIRATKTGRLRVGSVKKAGPVRAGK